jgi:hypothetical protein
MKKITFTILVFFLIFSCEKENDSVFSGITERDPSGIISGRIDETDWRFDDVWTDKEEQLFDPNNFKSTESLFVESDPIIPLPNIGSSSTAFPNPASSVFDFEINSTADTAKFVLVDSSYDIILSKKINGGSGLWLINVSDRTRFRLNALYRIYYRLQYEDGSIEKGHGDIKITN